MAIRSDQTVWIIQVHHPSAQSEYFPMAVVTGSKEQAKEMAEDIYHQVFQQPAPVWNSDYQLPFPDDYPLMYNEVAIFVWEIVVDRLNRMDELLDIYRIAAEIREKWL